MKLKGRHGPTYTIYIRHRSHYIAFSMLCNSLTCCCLWTTNEILFLCLRVVLVRLRHWQIFTHKQSLSITNECFHYKFNLLQTKLCDKPSFLVLLDSWVYVFIFYVFFFMKMFTLLWMPMETHAIKETRKTNII